MKQCRKKKIPGIAFCVVYFPICRPTDQETNQGVPCIGRFVSKAPGEFYYLNEAGLIDFRCGTTGRWTTREKVPWEMCETWMILLMVQKIWRSPVEVGRLSTIIYRVLYMPGGSNSINRKWLLGGSSFFPDWVNKSQLDSFLSMCFHESGR